MANNIYEKFSSEKFQFVQLNEKLHDQAQSYKPIGYFKDAWMRFRKNKASVTAAIIILLCIIFSLIGPALSGYKISDVDGIYAKGRPKCEALGIDGFWDGGMENRYNNKYIFYLGAIGMGAEDADGAGDVTWEEGLESEFSPFIRIGEAYSDGGTEYRDCRVDSYLMVGFRYVSLTKTQYDELRAWEEETGIQVVYPMVDTKSEWCDVNNADDANFWYRHAANSSPVDANGNRMKDLDDVLKNGLVDNYLRDENGNVLYYAAKDSNMLSVRVLYYNYFVYKNGQEPTHLMGTDGMGYDILVRICYGLRLSLLIAISVFIINFIIGSVYGAIEGYYGGIVDLLMERVSDILSGMPFIVVCTLVQLHFVNTGKMSAFGGVLFAFVLTGWISTAYRVRTQFYRFKNQEYVLAARTLGAKDPRIMFKHIFPNALGTIITSSALTIPSTIVSESTLSYLGIVNFNGRNIASLGSMLSHGQGYLSTDPHIILFPALFISLLMISFNLFGNGLRDAFNPSLRGTEE